MAYEIIKSDGTLLLELGVGLIDKTSSSLTFVGKNFSNFGEIQNNNFLHLTENFAALTEPPNKLTGQLWFDTSLSVLKVYNSQNWQSLAIVSTSSSVATSIGNLWFDNTNKQLWINDGTTFDLVGPEAVPGYGKTKIVSTKIKDTPAGDYHPVLECFIDDEIVSIISKDSFDVNVSESLTGFSSVHRGITFKNGSSSDTKLYGWSEFATNSDNLRNTADTAYIKPSINATASTLVERNSQAGITVSEITASGITSSVTTGTISGSWKIVNSLTPDTDGGAYLGTTNLRWSDVYTQNAGVGILTVSTINGTTVNATTGNFSGTLTSQNANSTNLKFTNLSDSLLNTVDKIDTDDNLGGNSRSHSKLSTQKAIKDYIDRLFSQLTGSTGDIQDSLGDLQSRMVPTGTVLYSAATTAPTGFVFANGQSLLKTTYVDLYMALGGTNSPYGQDASTFKVPDLRGEFIRGWDHGRGVDLGRTLGSNQSDMLETHNHAASAIISNTVNYQRPTINITDPGHAHPYVDHKGSLDGSNQVDSDGDYYNVTDQYLNSTTGNRTTGITATASGGSVSVNSTAAVTVNNNGGSETRPRNIALNAIIKT